MGKDDSERSLTCIRNIHSMKCRGYAELICVGLVVECLVKIESVAAIAVSFTSKSTTMNGFATHVNVDSPSAKTARPVSSEYPVRPRVPGIFGG